jgi:hypothetical protein
MKKTVGIVILLLILGCLGLFLLIQLVPYGHNHTNPSVVQEPAWASPQAHEIAKRACFDCHSNETTWYWYTNIAPFSWLIQNDVDEGRRRLNFSEWNRRHEIEEIGKVLREGEMPPLQYVLIHPSSRLSSQEQQVLLNGLGITASGEVGDD